MTVWNIINNTHIQALMVEAARDWLGTPFHHQGRMKHQGVDCLGLLVGVARELRLPAPDGSGRLLSDYDSTDYSHTPDAKTLLGGLNKLLRPTAKIAVGNVAVFVIDGSPQHLGIVSDYKGGYGLIHAYAPARKVVEHALDGWWRQRMVQGFGI